MHAAKNTWQLVVDLSCFPDVLVVSSCRSETTTVDQKSSVVDFRVMSTSFWFSGVPCVACFVVCPHVFFQFRFCMSRFASVGAHSTATVSAMCVYQVFGVRHT